MLEMQSRFTRGGTEIRGFVTLTVRAEAPWETFGGLFKGGDSPGGTARIVGFLEFDPSTGEIVAAPEARSDSTIMPLFGVRGTGQPTASARSASGVVEFSVSGANGIHPLVEAAIKAAGATTDATVIGAFGVSGTTLNAEVALFADAFPNFSVSLTTPMGNVVPLLNVQTAVGPTVGPYVSFWPSNFAFRGGISSSIPLGVQ
jgi:hypothetical protein